MQKSFQSWQSWKPQSCSGDRAKSDRNVSVTATVSDATPDAAPDGFPCTGSTYSSIVNEQLECMAFALLQHFNTHTTQSRNVQTGLGNQGQNLAVWHFQQGQTGPVSSLNPFPITAPSLTWHLAALAHANGPPTRGLRTARVCDRQLLHHRVQASGIFAVMLPACHCLCSHRSGTFRRIGCNSFIMRAQQVLHHEQLPPNWP